MGAILQPTQLRSTSEIESWSNVSNNSELVLSVYLKDRLGKIPLGGGRKKVENAVSYTLSITISHCSTSILF